MRRVICLKQDNEQCTAFKSLNQLPLSPYPYTQQSQQKLPCSCSKSDGKCPYGP